VIYAASASSPNVRLGVTVARRVGGAVVRNRIKRRVRECFRLTLRGILPAGTDLVVIARGGAGDLASAAIRDELVAAVRKAGVRRVLS
jgi:ribonuclease P protein component